MYSNLRILLRNLRRNGLYSAINVVGLSISLAAVLLILIWVSDELSFDKFHKRSEDIYLGAHTNNTSGIQYYGNLTPPLLATAAKEEVPEVENACRVFEYLEVAYLKHGENVLNNIHGSMVDPSFFSIFNFRIIEGDVNALLPDDYSVVLSQSAARTLFGDENPIGKIIIDDNRRSFHVTGVIADMPQNSSNRYNVIFSFSLCEQLYPEDAVYWDWQSCKTYFLLKPNANAAHISRKFTEIYQRNNRWDEFAYLLHPLEEENLYSLDGTPNTKLQACRLFLTAVVVLLLIACINYVNLVTARASRRNKEIYVRRILGARKASLFAQFFNESLLLFFCSLIVATLFVYLLFPVYNQVTGKQLEFKLFSASTLMLYGLSFLFTMLFAGIYPALSLSNRKGIKETPSGYKGINVILRKVLVVLQFSASVVLILVAATTNRQMHFIRTKNLGYEKEHVFYVNLSKEMRVNVDDVRIRMSQLVGVEGVSIASEPLSNVLARNFGISWEGKADDSRLPFFILLTDKDLIPLLNINIEDGRSFTGTPADDAHFIVNRAAVDAMGVDNPIGKRIRWNRVDGTIIGVTENFHFQNMHEPVKPLIILINRWLSNTNIMYVKVQAGNISEALKSVEKAYKEYSPDDLFEYHFVDDEFYTIYKSDIQTERLFNAFAIVAIFVSCLGLFGLVTYTAETKTKEIGIRKVLGASVGGLVEMLSKEFLILVGISMVIAFPLSYYWLYSMLQDYAYRISISWWMFALVALVIVALTILTVAGQALKSARANPVKAIKTE